MEGGDDAGGEELENAEGTEESRVSNWGSHLFGCTVKQMTKDGHFHSNFDLRHLHNTGQRSYSQSPCPLERRPGSGDLGDTMDLQLL